MKRLILSILLVLLFCSCIRAGEREGLAFWGLNGDDFSSESFLNLRVGYEFDDFLFSEPNNSIEIFTGTTLIPSGIESEVGKFDPPNVLTLGGIYILGDLIDPNNSLPWINDALLALLPEKAVAKPYFGAQGTWQFIDDDGAYFGGIVGLLAKLNPNSFNDMVIEADYNNFFDGLSTLRQDDEFVISLGFRFRTK